MIKLAVIADDLTGANDTAVQFSRYGMQTYVLLDASGGSELPDETDVVVLDTDSRAVPTDTAYKRVKTACEAVKAKGVAYLYKKVDSTLRGNLGAEIDAFVDVFKPSLVVIAPAFPQTNRITVGGYHLLNGLPVAMTEISRDPKAPVKESLLPELLRHQTKHLIGHIALNIVLESPQAINKAVAECLAKGQTWIVFDAVTEDNLLNIAKATAGYENVLWVGSAGLAKTLSEHYNWQAGGNTNLETGSDGPALVVAGSVSQVTRGQVQKLLQNTSVKAVIVDVEAVLAREEQEIERCVQEAAGLLDANYDVVITSAISEDAVSKAVKAGSSCGLDQIAVSNKVAHALGAITAVLANKKLAGMVLTGGDTAINACRALGASSLKIFQEVAPGIPLGQLGNGQFAGVRVVTKAGAFGDEQALVKAVQTIKAK
jgi:uncharacterized protein YgbK (DUF1537 family)